MDIFFIKPVTLLPIDGATLLGNIITVTAPNMHTVSRFLVNNVLVKTYVILSSSVAKITVPDGVLGRTIDSITAVGESDSVASIELTAGNNKKSPHLYVMQRLLRALFTEKGSDIFNKSSGAGLLRITSTNGSGVETAIMSAVIQATKEVKRTQGTGLAPNMTLSNARVVSVSFDKIAGVAAVSVELTIGDGSTLDTGFVVSR